MDITSDLSDRARAGSTLSPADLDALASADVLSLGMLADERRRLVAGNTVTYARVHELSAAGGPVPPGAGEVRVTTIGETLEATIATVLAAREVAGARLLTGFSLADLAGHAEAWGGLAVVLSQLKAAGLDGIAEAPVDRLTESARELRACAAVGLPVRCLSVSDPIHGSRTAFLLRVRDLADGFPALQTFAPLPRTQSTVTPTTGYDDVRTVALARLAIPHLSRIQVVWAQYGPKLAQVALTFGANDVDRVSAVNDESLGKRRTAVDDVTRNIVAAGFTPVERDAAR